MIALRPKGSMRFLRTPFLSSKTFPCQAKRLINRAMVGLNVVPGATIAVPSASPFGISPTGVFVKRVSRSACVMVRSFATSYAMIAPFLADPLIAPTSRFAQKKRAPDRRAQFHISEGLTSRKLRGAEKFCREKSFARDEIEIANPRKFCQI